MNMAIRPWLGALGVVGVLVPLLADAGQQSTTSATCTKYADGSGSCYGNFQAFRTHSDPSTYVSFVENSSGSKFFQAWWPTTGLVSCVPDSTVSGLWQRVMLHEGFFNISWNASGTCTSLILNNGSHHSTF